MEDADGRVDHLGVAPGRRSRGARRNRRGRYAGGPGLGTCMGPKRTEALLRAAGFGSVEMLDIKSQTNLFYAARP